MKNKNAIYELCTQLQAVSYRIDSLISGMDKLEEDNADMEELYEQFLLDEISHVQIIALEFTRLATEENENEDEAFMAGELNDTKEEQEDTDDIPADPVLEKENER